MKTQRTDANGCLSKGNPCDVLVGTKLQTEVDYAAVAVGAPTFVRTYNSGALVSHPAITTFPLGRGWFGSYFQSIKPVTGTFATVYAVRPDGSVSAFHQVPATPTKYVSDSESKDRLMMNQNGSWTYTTSTDDVEMYNSNGRLVSVRTRAGVVHTVVYGTSGIQSVTDSFGHSIRFVWSAGKISQIRDAADNIISLTYGSANNLASVNYPDGTQRRYFYELTGTGRTNLLTGLEDQTGTRYASWTYGTDNRVASSEHAGGIDRYDFTFNADGSRMVRNPMALTTTYSTNDIAGQRRYTSADQPCIGCNEFADVQYDASGNFSRTRDFRGTEMAYVYDRQRSLQVSRTEADGTALARTTATQWHPTYRLPTLITEFNRTTSFSYDGSGNLLTKTITDTAIGLVRTWTYTYNSFGQVLSENGPRTDVADITTYTYYNCSIGFQCGQVETITNALGQVTAYNTYNAHGLPLTITDPNGLITTLTYDLRQRLTSRTVGTEQSTFEYWPTGLLKKATLPDASFISYSYDAAHRLTGIADAEGNRIAYTLDAMGNRTGEEVFDPSNALTQTRTRVFNTLNQLWKELGAAGTPAVTTNFGYDNNGNQTSINAPLARNTIQGYDELNRLTQVTDPATGLTQYGYNALDQLISVTDPRNKVTSYTYNALGDLTQQVSPDTGTTAQTYDSAGNLQTKTDARNKTGTYSYDALNRVTQLSYLDQTITYEYDQNTNGKGRLTSLSDASGSTSFGYDALGRVTSRQQTIGGVSKAIGYSYDAAGQLQSVTLPSGNAVSYTYLNGKVASLTLNGSATIISGVLYQPFGPTMGWTWGNATLAVREYDADGNITDLDSAGLKTYSYDNAFRITGITDTADANLSQTYSYDVLDRLTSATGASLNQSWTYDANGNRLTQGGSTSSAYTVSTTNNRLNAVSGALSRTYTYDAAGNVIADGTASYTYDDAGRMVSVTKASVTTTYKLNALGQRVRKTTSGVNTYFVYDDAGHLVGEYDNGGALIQETIWFGDIPVGVLKPNESGGVSLFYVHTDHLNTPRRITRPSDNAIVWRWDSDPFGTAVPDQNPSGVGAFVYNLRFPGQYADLETGLNYNYFRDYDAAVGRYAQSDPIGLRGGINTYSYVNGNPINATDQRGLAGYFGGTVNIALWRKLSVGGGYTELFCKDECEKVRVFQYIKLCGGVASSSGASVLTGGASNMDGNKCRPENYSGYFAELAAGFGGVAGGIDIGLTQNQYHVPNGLSGVNQAGVGPGSPGGALMLCYYFFVGER